jgi:release factor glutamine methyltransferase
MTIREAEQQLSQRLLAIYDQRETVAIAALIMQYISGWKKMDRILNKSSPLSEPALDLLEKYTEELLLHKPVQYVLKESWFYGLKYFVNESVLIPRPETEELVKWILDDRPAPGSSILDMGTGSGCIAVSLKKNLPEIKMIACDISGEALDVARKNAASNQTQVEFLQLDFLNEEQQGNLVSVNCIAANPPYVPNHDKNEMRKNVTEYEPPGALFVPDDDPLIFYRAIADFGLNKLLPGGKIYTELHEKSAAAAKQLFSVKGYSSIEIKADTEGKDRILKATLLP